MAAEFVGRYMKDKRALPAIAFSTNTSSLATIGNDMGFEHVFSRQVEALVSEGDVVMGISTSGESPNVVSAIEAAHAKGAFTAALVGARQCRLDSLADIVIKAPSESTPRIQKMHILLIHAICSMVEEDF